MARRLVAVYTAVRHYALRKRCRSAVGARLHARTAARDAKSAASRAGRAAQARQLHATRRASPSERAATPPSPLPPSANSTRTFPGNRENAHAMNVTVSHENESR